jgi:hypothetical protein
MFALVIYHIGALVGIAGGVFSGGYSASGKAALVLGLVPVAGVYLAMAFC